MKSIAVLAITGLLAASMSYSVTAVAAEDAPNAATATQQDSASIDADDTAQADDNDATSNDDADDNSDDDQAGPDTATGDDDY